MLVALCCRPVAALAARQPPVRQRLAPGVVVARAALVVDVLLAPGIGMLPLLGMALAAGSASASVMPLRGRSLRRMPLRSGAWSSPISASRWRCSAWRPTAPSRRRSWSPRVPGETLAGRPVAGQVARVEPGRRAQLDRARGELRASRGGGAVGPQAADALFLDPPTETSEAAMHTGWNGQLYAVSAARPSGRWQLRLWWKPFVTLIWYGGVLIALGGAARADRPLWRGARAPRAPLAGGRAA